LVIHLQGTISHAPLHRSGSSGRRICSSHSSATAAGDGLQTRAPPPPLADVAPPLLRLCLRTSPSSGSMHNRKRPHPSTKLPLSAWRKIRNSPPPAPPPLSPAIAAKRRCTLCGNGGGKAIPQCCGMCCQVCRTAGRSNRSCRRGNRRLQNSALCGGACPHNSF
jgi:hypothetical protein